MPENKKYDIKDFEHRAIVTAMLKVIAMAPIDDTVKMVLRCRIWGKDPAVFAPMTAYEIAHDCLKYSRRPVRAEVEEIQRMEEFGKFACTQFLLSTNAQDIVDKYNKDFKKNNAEMFGKQPYERKRFSV